MNYRAVFEKTQEQYQEIHEWIQAINVCIDVLQKNSSTQTIKNEKILKRIARIEDKLKIVNIEEGG